VVEEMEEMEEMEEVEEVTVARVCWVLHQGVWLMHLIIIGLVVMGCSKTDYDLKTTEKISWQSELNYVKTVRSVDQLLLRVTCQYIGKKPGNPNSYLSSHNYTVIDTSFYKITFENLSQSDLVIESVRYHMKYGNIRGTSYYGSNAIRRSWGTNIIKSGASITRSNNMVWSSKTSNTLFKVYSLRLKNSKNLQGNQRSNSFKVEVPLRYHR